MLKTAHSIDHMGQSLEGLKWKGMPYRIPGSIEVKRSQLV